MEKTIERIHDTALRILQEIGVRFIHPEALAILSENGIRLDGDKAFFTPEQIMNALSTAPAQFTLSARNKTHDMEIGAPETFCAPGYGCASIIDRNGCVRNALLNDYVTLAKLVHQSDHFKINGGILAQPCDVNAKTSHLVMLYAAILSSDKCLMGIPENRHHIKSIMSMMEILFGREDLLKHHRILTMISTISPLSIDSMGLESMMVAAGMNQPMIISPAPAAGTTGPIGLGGNLALATAEALAAIAFTQMIRPGVPVIFGLQCYGADLRTGNISIGSPAYATQAGYCALLAKKYGLPSRGGGSVNDAAAVTVQAGYESMMSMLTAVQNGISLAVHSSGILNNFSAISYEKFMVDLEILDRVRLYMDKISLKDDEDLSFEVIKSVGAGGEFLTAPDTLKKCRSHSYMPRIGLRGNRNGQHETSLLFDSMDKALKGLLNTYEQPALDPAIAKALFSYLTGPGEVDPKILEPLSRY